MALWHLPPVPNRSRPCVGGRVGGKFAVELGKQRHAIGDAKLRAGGGERGIFRQRRAVDDEAVTRQRLEHRQERQCGHRVHTTPSAACRRDGRGWGH